VSTQVIVPRLGVTVTEVTIVEWLVKEGATVDEGEPLLTVATDKVEQELPSPAGGTLRQLAVPDEVCLVGALIGEIS
jgi:pyruvate/2-oxoglutarate dehydrogenase complex dihydrolipoamide acyltransferase (E2) component